MITHIRCLLTPAEKCSTIILSVGCGVLGGGIKAEDTSTVGLMETPAFAAGVKLPTLDEVAEDRLLTKLPTALNNASLPLCKHWTILRAPSATALLWSTE